jgi:hypothetical protein
MSAGEVALIVAVVPWIILLGGVICAMFYAIWKYS